MIVNVYGAKCTGIQAVLVTVEVEICLGIGIHLVGLADAAVKESLLRTVTALGSENYRIPGKKIIINLAPADLQKQGSGYDLPIAIGIIAASGQKNLPGIGKCLIMGELGLDASVRYVSGTLPMVELARELGFENCILPEGAALEAADCDGINVYGVKTLREVISILEGEEDCSHLLIRNTAAYAKALEMEDNPSSPYVDFADIIGQESAKRGMEIAAAGGHNALLLGAPGSGKSSLAKALAGILPPMTKEEAAIVSKVYSVAGKTPGRLGNLRRRPFRAPHISASKVAVLGGGSGENILPGEVSLASGGVLFLDEFCEAPKTMLESLRAPLEDRRVVISRLKSKVEYPASFMLVAASNPCPCGYWGEKERCTCTPGQRLLYLSKLSGPVMDRIDLQMWLHPVDASALVRAEKAEPSEAVAKRVARAREIQLRRFAGEGIFCNAEMDGKLTERHCPLSEECKQLMERIIESLGLSARAYTRIIKIARTIADLAGEEDILPAHIAEASSYRFLDRRNILDL